MDTPIKVLVVEDDNDINQLLCRILKTSGYFPQSCYSGTEALLYLERQEWDMVLLDLMLPGMSGEEVLAKINELSSVPVIIISAKGEQQTKISTLRAGAVDYITKPFDIEEVSARVYTHLNRYKRTAAIPVQIKELKHKGISLNLDAKTVTINGKELTLTAREYSILSLLMTSPKKIFTKANLFNSVWGEDYLGDENTVNVHMSNLRSKLSKADPSEEYIQTIWGRGYRLKS